MPSEVIAFAPDPAHRAMRGPQLIVGDIKYCADQSSCLGCRLDIGNVLKAALHLGPLASLRAVGASQIVLEGQVLQRQGEDGRARALAGLGELLEQVRVGVAAFSDRFEILAELVDDQQQRRLRCQAAGDLDEGCGGRARSARVVRRRVRQGALEGLGRRERAGSGDLAVAAQYIAECSARRIVWPIGSRLAVTKPRWKPRFAVSWRRWARWTSSPTAGEASSMSFHAAVWVGLGSPRAASRSSARDDLPDPYGPVSDQAPPAVPCAAVAAIRSTTSRARAVTV